MTSLLMQYLGTDIGYSILAKKQVDGFKYAKRCWGEHYDWQLTKPIKAGVEK